MIDWWTISIAAAYPSSGLAAPRLWDVLLDCVQSGSFLASCTPVDGEAPAPQIAPDSLLILGRP